MMVPSKYVEEPPHPRGLSIPRGGLTSSSCSNFDFYLRDADAFDVSKSVPDTLGQSWSETCGSLQHKKKSLPSPRNLPKFIKQSLTKLWRSKSESPHSSSTSGSVGNQEDAGQLKAMTPDSSMEIYESISLTQSMLDFIEETRSIGLPLIPFKYPSCYLHIDKPSLIKSASGGGTNGDDAEEELPPDHLSSIITEADRQLNHEDHNLRSPDYATQQQQQRGDFFSFPFIDDEYIDMKPLGV